MMDCCAQGVSELAALGIEKALPTELWSGLATLKYCSRRRVEQLLLLRDHPAAMVEIRDLARAIRKEMDASQPQTLYPGEWHLPHICDCVNDEFAPHSAARCARVSYRSLATGKPSTYGEDMLLFDKLAGDDPKHLSPLEHPAMALLNHERCGNLVGWRSLRKDMFGEVESGGI